MEFIIGNAIKHFVPQVEKLRKKKTMRMKSLILADLVCDQLLSSHEPNNDRSAIFQRAILTATKHGNTDIVRMIIIKYPSILYYTDPNGMNVFMMAVNYRLENIINLIHLLRRNDNIYMFYDWIDEERNSVMHICGKLPPPGRLSLVVNGAALQMQRELQWFKDIEKYINPSLKTSENNEGQTPQMIFTKEHQNLKAEGEKWMKETANACTITAALIATVMFAAAFTVPGGLESSTGFPLFSNRPAFKLFVVSNAISLFTSIFAIFMFLFVLTSRYAKEDFLYILPKRLGMGILSLFISITFMTIAFCATFFLITRRDNEWLPILVTTFSCFPISCYILPHFPLIMELVSSAYGPSIFRKETDFIDQLSSTIFLCFLH